MHSFILSVMLLFYIHTALQDKPASSGSLSFTANGKPYKADKSHARAYIALHNYTAYLKAANTNNLLINAEWKPLGDTGTYLIKSKNGSASFTLEGKTYRVKFPDDFFYLHITSALRQGSFIILSGTFHGLLYHDAGHTLRIENGKFETYAL